MPTTRYQAPPKAARVTLTRDEEEALLARYKATKDPVAGDRLVRAYEGLVVATVWPYARRQHLELDDMLQEGRCGFLKACLKFKPELGSLATYAVWWIRAALRAHRLKARAITLPAWLDDALRLAARLKVQANTVEDLIAAGIVREDTKVKGCASLGMLTSLDTPIGGADDGASTALVDVIASDVEPPDEAADRRRREAYEAEELATLVATLHPRERMVLSHRTLARPGKEQTLREIGEGLGLSRERIRQVERDALRKLERRASDRAAQRKQEQAARAHAHGVVPEFLEAA